MSFPKPDTHDSLDEDGSDREDRPMLLQHAESAAQPPIPRLQKLKVLVLVGIIAITFETGNATRAAPWFASLEESICQTTTQLNHTLDCTENKAVHIELAEILGVLQLLECLPILLLSGFYGSLADRIGRRAVLLLGYIGLIGSAAWTTAVLWFAPVIPVRYIWLGPLFTIVGGGPSVSISILMTSAADVVDSAQRATVYSFVHGTALTAVILGSFAGSVMMSTTLGNFVPLGLGLSLMILAALIAIFLPDRVVPDHESVTTNTAQPAAAPSEGKDIPAFEAMKLSMHNMWKMDGMLLALLAGFVSMLGQQVQVLTLQYFPTRLKLSIAEANLFNIVLSAVNLLVLFAILPTISRLICTRSHWSTFARDLLLAHSSTLIFLTGAVVLSLAESVPLAILGFCIFGSGIGLSSLLRSIFVELFPPERAAFATTVISSAKAIGGSLAGPMYSYTYTISLGSNVWQRGLPFIVSMMCFVVVEIALAVLQYRSRKIRKEIMNR